MANISPNLQFYTPAPFFCHPLLHTTTRHNPSHPCCFTAKKRLTVFSLQKKLTCSVFTAKITPCSVFTAKNQHAAFSLQKITVESLTQPCFALTRAQTFGHGTPTHRHTHRGWHSHCYSHTQVHRQHSQAHNMCTRHIRAGSSVPLAHTPGCYAMLHNMASSS